MAYKYSDEMAKSIERLHSTRQERMKQQIPRLSPEEKAGILKQYHPDYRTEKMRTLKVGASAGSRTPHEFADLFEAYSKIDPKKIDLSKIDYETDVLVIGGGGAGASAALLAQEHGASVIIATKLRIGDANTMMAQGGIQAADKENDSPPIHYIDVIGGGGYHNKPELVQALVEDGPLVIEWLEDLGVMFDKMPDGTMQTIHGGGTSRKRMHTAKDYTGGEIMKTLRDELWNRSIEILEFMPAVELLTDDTGRCTGAVLNNLETDEYRIVRTKATIIATGGSGRLHVQGFPTSNHYGATADGLVIAYRAGCRLAFMDTIQYHPTGAIFPEQIVGQLVTEKVRGLGAHLVNNEGKRYIYELETRDVESAAIIRECTERGTGVPTPTGHYGIWLDTPLIDILHGEGTVKKELPAMYRQYMRYDIDISKDPILIYPTQHYQNGGIDINAKCETGVPGLYVAGECAGGIHGRNRLMGNSLLDVVVFGRRAGEFAAEYVKTVQHSKITLNHVESYHSALEKAGITPERKSPMILPDYVHHDRRLKI